MTRCAAAAINGYAVLLALLPISACHTSRPSTPIPSVALAPLDTALIVGAEVARGDREICAVRQVGGLACWPIMGGAGVAHGNALHGIALGRAHGCGLDSLGAAWCWGDNRLGQLGDGGTRRAEAPRRIARGPRFEMLALAGDHSCGRTAAGEVWCWGDQWDGAVGTESAGATVTVPSRVPLPAPATALEAARSHTCAVLSSGASMCWGWNGEGQLRPGGAREYFGPVEVGRTLQKSGTAAAPARRPHQREPKIG